MSHAGSEPSAISATKQLRTAFLEGCAFTRPSACDKFNITGSTFRWVVKQMRAEGIPLVYEEVRGRRNASTRRWRVEAE
jgi:hypothetical protein